MEEIKREELDELLNVQKDVKNALKAERVAKKRLERKAARCLYYSACKASHHHSNKLEEKTGISSFCFEEIAGVICERELPKEAFYKIIELFGVKVI